MSAEHNTKMPAPASLHGGHAAQPHFPLS